MKDQSFNNILAGLEKLSGSAPTRTTAADFLPDDQVFKNIQAGLQKLPGPVSNQAESFSADELRNLTVNERIMLGLGDASQADIAQMKNRAAAKANLARRVLFTDDELDQINDSDKLLLKSGRASYENIMRMKTSAEEGLRRERNGGGQTAA